MAQMEGASSLHSSNVSLQMSHNSLFDLINSVLGLPTADLDPARAAAPFLPQSWNLILHLPLNPTIQTTCEGHMIHHILLLDKALLKKTQLTNVPSPSCSASSPLHFIITQITHCRQKLTFLSLHSKPTPSLVNCYISVFTCRSTNFSTSTVNVKILS